MSPPLAVKSICQTVLNISLSKINIAVATYRVTFQNCRMNLYFFMFSSKYTVQVMKVYSYMSAVLYFIGAYPSSVDPTNR